MTDPPFPLRGSTLVLGPSQSGKTKLTAAALDSWVERNGVDGLVVLEFAPEVERDGTILGGRLDRFTTIPDGAWYGRLDAHAPRAEGESEEESVALARENAQNARKIVDSAPDPRAVFVNDATIPLQHESFPAERFTTYCGQAETVVMNAFKSDELGTVDPVSRQERSALEALESWADRTVTLDVS